MNENNFYLTKKYLHDKLNVFIKESKLDCLEKNTYAKAKVFLDKINYSNRLLYKGGLSKLLTDELPKSNELTDEILKFDSLL